MDYTPINENFEDWSIDCQDFLTEEEVSKIRKCTVEVLTSIFNREKDPIRRTVLMQVFKDRTVAEIVKVYEIGFIKAKKHHYYEKLKRLKEEREREEEKFPCGKKMTRGEVIEYVQKKSKDKEKERKLENELYYWKEKENEIEE